MKNARCPKSSKSGEVMHSAAPARDTCDLLAGSLTHIDDTDSF